MMHAFDPKPPTERYDIPLENGLVLSLRARSRQHARLMAGGMIHSRYWPKIDQWYEQQRRHSS